MHLFSSPEGTLTSYLCFRPSMSKFNWVTYAVCRGFYWKTWPGASVSLWVNYVNDERFECQQSECTIRKRILMHLNVCRSKAACTTAHILTHQSIQADHSKLKAFLFSPLRIRLQQSTIWKAASFNTVSVCGALMCFTIYKCHFYMPALRQGSYLMWQTSQTRLLGLALFPVFC